jgi:hypothetical protein
MSRMPSSLGEGVTQVPGHRRDHRNGHHEHCEIFGARILNLHLELAFIDTPHPLDER